jgi:hypothetical protein
MIVHWLVPIKEVFSSSPTLSSQQPATSMRPSRVPIVCFIVLDRLFPHRSLLPVEFWSYLPFISQAAPLPPPPSAFPANLHSASPSLPPLPAAILHHPSRTLFLFPDGKRRMAPNPPSLVFHSRRGRRVSGSGGGSPGCAIPMVVGWRVEGREEAFTQFHRVVFPLQANGAIDRAGLAGSPTPQTGSLAYEWDEWMNGCVEAACQKRCALYIEWPYSSRLEMEPTPLDLPKYPMSSVHLFVLSGRLPASEGIEGLGE